tara:strand:- start:2151 stop:2522 length:372 start_codon:yes stop_codon:yes gene_type:complete
MACGTVLKDGDTGTIDFGVEDDELGLVTQSVSSNQKVDKKEIRDKCGIIVAVATYNPTAEITIEGYGELGSTNVGDTLTLTSSDYNLETSGAKNVIEEITIEKTNEDFVKTTVKATQYSGINS